MTAQKLCLLSRGYAVICAFAVKTRPCLTAICSCPRALVCTSTFQSGCRYSPCSMPCFRSHVSRLIFQHNRPYQTRAVSIKPLDWFVYNNGNLRLGWESSSCFGCWRVHASTPDAPRSGDPVHQSLPVQVCNTTQWKIRIGIAGICLTGISRFRETVKTI